MVKTGGEEPSLQPGCVVNRQTISSLQFGPKLSRFESLNCWSVQMILDLWLPAGSKTTFGLLNKVLTCLAVYSPSSAM